VCNATVGISDKCKTLTPIKHTQQKLMFSFAEHIKLWVSLHFRSEGLHFSCQEEEFRVAPKNYRLSHNHTIKFGWESEKSLTEFYFLIARSD